MVTNYFFSIVKETAANCFIWSTKSDVKTNYANPFLGLGY